MSREFLLRHKRYNRNNMIKALKELRINDFLYWFELTLYFRFIENEVIIRE